MKSRFARIAATALLLVGALTGNLLTGPTPAGADDTVSLKLMVSDCDDIWLENAEVHLKVYSPPGLLVFRETGITDGSGYIEFSICALDDGSVARVTVTPGGGGTSDPGHMYTLIVGELGGGWEIGTTPDEECPDTWYDFGAAIIQCRYNPPLK